MNRRKRIQFWGENKDDDRLVLEIIAGEKTATVCAEDDFYVPDGDNDDGSLEEGDLVDVYDLHARKRCTIRIIEVCPTLFGDIPDKLWMGEHCTSAEHFREAHRQCWPELDLTDDFRLMATYFELVDVTS